MVAAFSLKIAEWFAILCAVQVNIKVAHCPEVYDKASSVVQDMATNLHPSAFGVRNLQVG